MSRAIRPSWTCVQCLVRQKSIRQSLATAALAPSTPTNSRNALYQVSHVDPATDHDDRLLRQIFDNKRVWEEFSQRSLSEPKTGLFQNRYLTSTRGFQEFADTTIARCKKIVAKVLQISTVHEYKGVVRELDRLSDLLCRSIDLCEFLRSAHPDPAFQHAASDAYATVYNYMNTLNTTTGLCEQLKTALATPEVVESWSHVENMVAQGLMKDFQQAAINLPEDKRREWRYLSDQISRKGHEFSETAAPARDRLVLDSSKLKGMEPTILKPLTDRRGRVHLPSGSTAATAALRQVKDEETRKEIYIASRTAAADHVQLLERFLSLRAQLAEVAGYPSFASMTLVDKMAKTPEAVLTFLSALSAQNTPTLKRELDAMLALKRAENPDGAFTRINAWDKDYFRARLAQTRSSPPRAASRSPDFLPAFLSIGTVMQGLSRLFTRLYGVRFVPRETQPGESWSPDVRRLDVVDDVEGRIAVVYCDIFTRRGKNAHPAHFTVRCSRDILEPEIREARETSEHPDPTTASPADLTNDGMAVGTDRETGRLRQLPTIVLVCDFASPTDGGAKPALLNFHDLQTLFHEMGHAIHSILGRTSLQAISGTRCPTDFAELPSVLMESFATDRHVLALFARHWETDAPLPYRLVDDRLRQARHGGGAAAETEGQILMAALDQACHSSAVLPGGVVRGGGGGGGGRAAAWDSTAAWHGVHRDWALVPEAPGTSWQGFFGHLVGYGGVYYAYLFDRVIAKRVWEAVFRGGDGSLDREGGERFRREVLRWGGGRDAWECVGGLLGGEEGEALKAGGKGAMGIVGGWGL